MVVNDHDADGYNSTFVGHVSSSCLVAEAGAIRGYSSCTEVPSPPGPGRKRAVPPARCILPRIDSRIPKRDRKSTRLNSSHVAISYAVFCLKKKNKRDEE